MLAAVLNPSALEVSHLEMVFRLACALFVGAVIGTEREYTHRPAGMRTHILVSVGSCVVSVFASSNNLSKSEGLSIISFVFGSI